MPRAKSKIKFGSQPAYSFQNLDGALSFRPFAPEDTDLHAFQTITKPSPNSKALKFLYRNRAPLVAADVRRRTECDESSSSSSSFSSSSSIPRPRLVHPYHLACINNLWYLFAWDPAKRDLRTFALHRLTKPQLTNQKFTKPKNFDPAELLRGSLNVFKGSEDHDILIQFDPWAQTKSATAAGTHPNKSPTSLTAHANSVYI